MSTLFAPLPLLLRRLACLHPLVNPSIPRESIDFLASYEASGRLSRILAPALFRPTIVFRFVSFDKKGTRWSKEDRKRERIRGNAQTEERESIMKRNANKRMYMNNNTEKRV